MLIANSIYIEEGKAKHILNIIRIMIIIAKQIAKTIKKNSITYLIMIYVLEQDDDIDVQD